MKQARSDEQKDARRQAILRAARAELDAVGVQGLNMAGLGRRAGMAKGTLYLYFAAREDVLLALFGQAAAAWLDDFHALAGPGDDGEALAEVIVRVSRGTPHFLALLAAADWREVADTGRSDLQIWQNRMASHMAVCLGTPMGRARQLAAAVAACLCGSARLSSEDRALGSPVALVLSGAPATGLAGKAARPVRRVPPRA